MRRSLADSLGYIFSATEAQLGLPASRIRTALDAIKAHRVAPGVFGRYYKLVLAIQNRAYDDARRLFLRIVDLVQEIPVFTVVPYSDQALGEEKALYGELIDWQPESSASLCTPGCAEGFDRRVREALDLIAAADRALADEFRDLVVQVVGAAPAHQPGSRQFGSVSSFMLWGLMILNMERYGTAVDLVPVLVHEAAHLLLFANSIDEPLVTNPIEERYASPLRSDPRPMDGVFHATFVAARMHYVTKKLREATTDAFAPVPAEELDQNLATLRGLYFDGLETLREHGKLTATGRRIIDESLDYMQAG